MNIDEVYNIRNSKQMQSRMNTYPLSVHLIPIKTIGKRWRMKDRLRNGRHTTHTHAGLLQSQLTRLVARLLEHQP